MEDRLSVVLALGIAESRAKEIVKKDAAFASLRNVILLGGLAEKETTSKSVGALLYTLSSTFPKAGSKGSLECVAKAIVAQKIDSNDRLTAALQLAEQVGPGAQIGSDELAKHCLFGVEYSETDIANAANVAAADAASWDALGKVLEQARKALPFCDGGKVKLAVDAALTAKLGAPKGKEKKGEKKEPKPATAAPKKKIAAPEKLPPIDVDAPSSIIAKQLLLLAADPNQQHALEMIADTIAALRRNSYAAGLASAKNTNLGVRLPERMNNPQL